MKRSPLKKISEKKKAMLEQSKKEQIEMWNFFYQIWENRVHRCEICNISLGLLPQSYMFDHIIEKSKRPDLKFVSDNIVLTCLECHSCKSNGHPKEKHLQLINKLKEKYGSKN